MARSSVAGVCAALGAVFLTTGVACAVSPADKCEAAKLKIAGKYDLCRLLAEARAAKTGGMPDFSTCDSAYSTKWSQAEMKAGGACPSNGDVATMQAFLSQGTTAVGGALAGAPLQACGNGVIDPGEQCDQSNLNGQSCLSQGFAAGVLACGPGCILDTSGCSSARLVDNGDGTASDLQTGLMWEKKTFGECINLIGGHPIACALNADCTNNGGGGVCQSCPHCLNGFYTWTASGSPYPPNGTAFTTFLYALNGGTSLVAGDVPTGCFAGHCDWRLPTGYELGSLAFAGISNCGVTAADTFCTDPVLGPGLNALNGYFYWSSTSSGYDLSSAWVLGPGNGGDGAAVIPFAKTSAEPVRAVRGGP